MVQIRLKINSVDLSATLLEPPDADWEIERQVAGEVDIFTFMLHDPTNSITLIGGHEVTVEKFSDSTTLYFGGHLTEVVQITSGIGRIYQCRALGWVFDLSRTVVNQVFVGKSDQFIITDASTGIFLGTSAATVQKDLSAYTVTTANVLEGVANTQLRVYNGETIQDIMDNLAGAIGFIWGVTPAQVVFFREMDAIANSQSLSDSPDESASFGYHNFKYMRNFQEIVNAVYVYGGWAITEAQTRNYKADGTETDFIVPHHWRIDETDGSLPVVEENTGTDGAPVWATRTVGRVQDVGSFQVLWDELGRGFFWTTAPTNAGDLGWRVTSDLFEPVREEAKNQASITANGRFEIIIKDDSIRDEEIALDRARAELKKRASEGERITCNTYQDDFEPGQALTVVNSIHGLNDSYMVHKLVMRGLGGAETEYELSLNKVIT